MKENEWFTIYQWVVSDPRVVTIKAINIPCTISTQKVSLREGRSIQRRLRISRTAGYSHVQYNFFCKATCFWKRVLSHSVTHCGRSESEESIAFRRWSTLARDPSWLWNSGQRSPEVQNKVISGSTIFFKTKKHSSRIHTTRFSSSGGTSSIPQTGPLDSDPHPRQTTPAPVGRPPLGSRPWRQTPPPCRPPVGKPPLPCGQTNTCKYITLPRNFVCRR